MARAAVQSDIIPNLASFNRHLKAENLSPLTQETYSESVNQLAAYLKDQGMPLEVGKLRREHIEAFITYPANHPEARHCQ